jgi:Kelch motif
MGAVDRKRRTRSKIQRLALSPMPTGRDHLGVVASGGKVYAVGGRVFFDRNRNLPANEMYDPATNTWERLAPMPTARSGIAGAAMGGHIYTFGGEGTMSQAFDQTEAYEVATDSWATMAPMPTGRHGMGAAVSGGRIYVITGGPGAGVTGSRVGVPRSAVNEVFIP